MNILNTVSGSDPFIPRPPDKNAIGRMWSQHGLRPGWACRWCGRALYSFPRAHGVVVCVHCDEREDR